jgi:hypothetical protein
MPTDADWRVIDKLVLSVIPESFSIEAITSIDQRSLTLLPPVERSQLTINLRPQIIHAVGGVVAQEIRGDVNISQDDERLLQLIRQQGDNQSAELTAAVQVLSDTAITNSDRLSNAQKLKGFVFSLRDKLGPVASNLLIAYLEKKLGLK